tara:strand:+ start:411 stop:1061 length:651 start_codon:yes stop_codon:yes gene_type:complete
MPSWKKLIVSGSDASLNSLSVDGNITLEDSIIQDSGDLTLDIGGNLIVDVDGAQVRLEDAGTEFGRLSRVSSDLVIKSMGNNNDLLLKGVDDTTTITALKLDMSAAGKAFFNDDVVAFSSSDKDLKDNITPIENPIDKIKEIGGYEFDWNNKSSYEGHDVGVIAQEIEKVLPEVVTTRDNGYKAVKYEKIVALLIEGIKEQQLQIDDLKKQLNEKN